MRFPYWNEFIDSLTAHENRMTQNIQQFKNDHPILDRVFRSSLKLLPSPLNTIAEEIYGSAAGDPETKMKEVIDYLSNIQKQGETHYRETTLRLETVLSQTSELKDIVAQQNTLIMIQEALVSTDNVLNRKIDDLTKIVNSMSGNVSTLVNALGTGLRLGDSLLSTYHGPYGSIADQQGNIIRNLAEEDIKADDLDALGTGDKKLILSFQQIMLDNYYVFSDVNSRLDREVNPSTKALIKLD